MGVWHWHLEANLLLTHTVVPCSHPQGTASYGDFFFFFQMHFQLHPCHTVFSSPLCGHTAHLQTSPKHDAYCQNESQLPALFQAVTPIIPNLT